MRFFGCFLLSCWQSHRGWPLFCAFYTNPQGQDFDLNLSILALMRPIATHFSSLHVSDRYHCCDKLNYPSAFSARYLLYS